MKTGKQFICHLQMISRFFSFRNQLNILFHFRTKCAVKVLGFFFFFFNVVLNRKIFVFLFSVKMWEVVSGNVFSALSYFSSIVWV